MRRYSLGVFLNIFTNDTKDWMSQLRKIKSLGQVEHIEILLEYIPRTKKEINLLERLLEGYRTIIHAPFMDITLLSPHKQIVETSEKILLSSIEMGSFLDSELLTIHAGNYPFFWEKDHVIQQLKKSLNKLEKKATFPIAVENMSFAGNTQPAYPSTPEEILTLSKNLGNNIKTTIDTGHLLKDGFNVYSCMKQINNIYNIHLHDGHKGAAHLKLGDGKLETNKFVKFLEDIDYNKFVTIEVVGKKNIRDSWGLLKRELGE